MHNRFHFTTSTGCERAGVGMKSPGLKPADFMDILRGVETPRSLRQKRDSIASRKNLIAKNCV
jgi:hypothetical protein